jgi:hypothetical protein
MPKINILGNIAKFAEATAEANFMEVKVGSNSYEVNKIGEGDLHILPNGKTYFAYRMLSQAEVGIGSRHHTDFTNCDLSQFVNLAKGIPFHIDHRDWSSVDSVGAVVDAYFSDNIDGTGVAGINGIIEIDTALTYYGQSCLEIAKRVKNGYMLSGSVQVQYSFTKSHDVEDFGYRVGSTASDGRKVHKIAQNIEKFYEFSALAHGADEHAKILSDDKQSYLNILRNKFAADKGKFNTVLIPNGEGIEKFTIESEEDTFAAEVNAKYIVATDELNQVKVKLAKAETTLSTTTSSLTTLTTEHTVKLTEVTNLYNTKLQEFKTKYLALNVETIKEYNVAALQLKAVTSEDNSIISLEEDLIDIFTKVANFKEVKNKLNKALGISIKKEVTTPNKPKPLSDSENFSSFVDEMFG